MARTHFTQADFKANVEKIYEYAKDMQPGDLVSYSIMSGMVGYNVQIRRHCAYRALARITAERGVTFQPVTNDGYVVVAAKEQAAAPPVSPPIAVPPADPAQAELQPLCPSTWDTFKLALRRLIQHEIGVALDKRAPHDA